MKSQNAKAARKLGRWLYPGTLRVAVLGGLWCLSAQASSVVAWGNNSSCQCDVPPGLTDAVTIAAGGMQSLALKADGTVVPWGTYWNGSAYVPMTVPAGLSNVVAISAGGAHALALVGDAPPVAQAAASNLHWDTNCLSLSIPTQNGRVYRLDCRDSLSATNWSALPRAAGIDSARVLSDNSASNSPRIYRVRRW